jgi:hypothetical protein
MKNEQSVDEQLHSELGLLVQIMDVGGHLAIEMHSSGTVSYDEWVQEVRKRIQLPDNPTNNLRLIWVWDSLRKAEAFREEFRKFPPAGMVWNHSSEPILVLDRESLLVIGLSPSASRVLLTSGHKDPLEEIATIRLIDDLYMRPGRNDHLECMGCRCLLQLRASPVYSRERELDILGIEDTQLAHLSDGRIVVEVGSINQAYTVASRRLEPDRHSHGGNIYQNVVYVNEIERLQLDYLRLLVEVGRWGSKTEKRNQQLPLFPDKLD